MDDIKLLVSEPVVVIPTIEVSVKEFADMTGAAGQYKQNNITANTPYVVETDVDWLDISPANGTGMGLPVATRYMANSYNNSGEPRTALITVSSPTALVAPIEFTITQDVMPPYLNSDVASIIGVAATGESGTINVSSNVVWTAEASDWIELDPLSGTGDGLISYTIAENTGGARNGSITLTGTGVTDVIISVSQLAAGASEVQVYTINVLTNTVVSGGTTAVGTGYNEYKDFKHTNEYQGGTPNTAQFDLTSGMRNTATGVNGASPAGSMTIGTNATAGNFARMTAFATNYPAVANALTEAGITYTGAAAGINRTTFNNISRVEVMGGYDEGITMALAYSIDGSTWTVHPDGVFTPSAPFGGLNFQTKAFEFSTPITGQFAVIAMTNSTAAVVSRIQNVKVDYFAHQ
jgi:hypothetical protein